MTRTARIPTLLMLAAVVYAIWAVEAAQAAVCGDRNEMVTALAERFGEQQIGIGLSKRAGSVFETWANPNTGTWTILEAYTNGGACSIAVGEAWQSTDPVKGDPT